MNARLKTGYLPAFLLALATHAAFFSLSWEASPRAKILAPGSTGVEIRLAAPGASTAQASDLPALSGPEALPEPELEPARVPVAQPAPTLTPPLAAATAAEARPLPRRSPRAAAPAAAASPGAHFASSGSGGAGAPQAAAPSSPEPLGALVNKSPQYPKLARQRGQEGTVTLKVEVSAEGQTLSVAVLTSSGHSLLDKAAADAVKKWRFSPARKNGAAITGEAEITVEFRLE